MIDCRPTVSESFENLVCAVIERDRKKYRECLENLNYQQGKHGLMPDGVGKIKVLLDSLSAVDIEEKVELTEYEKKLLKKQKSDTVVECVLNRTNLSRFEVQQLIIDYLLSL